MLAVRHLQASYGAAQVLFDISLDIRAGEVVTLLGRNGMGKTTTIRAIMGLLPPTDGTVTFDGAVLTGRQPYHVAQAGIGLVPEGRQIFPTLSVEQNLIATAASRHGAAPVDLARDIRVVPQIARAPRQSRLAALGRRAADAGHRTRSDDEPETHDSR